MIISAIKQQIKRQDRYSVYIDGTYSCAFSETELLKLGLHVGQELSQAEFEHLKDDSVRDKARYQALGQLSRRQRSEWELRDYLKRKDYTNEVISSVINELADYGYVDDHKFAKAWVANRRLLKAISRRRLYQELRQKRVSDEVIVRVLAEDETDDSSVLREFVTRKRKQTKYQDNSKLMQYLIRQGYKYDDIKTAFSDDGSVDEG